MLRLAIAVSFALPLAVAAAGQHVSVSGRYESNWDEVQLSQDGSYVRGTYVCCGGGAIEGRITGNTLRYRWKQPGGWGTGVWKIDGDQLLGTWGWRDDDHDGGRWDLVRSTQLAH